MQIDKCLKCCRKHLRQSAICWLESQKGHEDKWDMACGHMAEAEDAWLEVAHLIREERLCLENDASYVVNYNYLFEQLDVLFEKYGVYYASKSKG